MLQTFALKMFYCANIAVLFGMLTLSLTQDRGDPAPVLTREKEGSEVVRKFEDLVPEAHEFRQSSEQKEEYRKYAEIIFQEVWAIPVPGHEAKFDPSKFAAIKFVVWDPTFKRSPGRNHPILEMYRDDELVQVLVLEDVHWMSDVWAATHEGSEFIYIKGDWRFRSADPIYVYEINRERPGLEFMATFFPRDELEAESDNRSEQAEAPKP